MPKRPSDIGVYDWEQLLAELIIGGATAYHPDDAVAWVPTDIDGCVLWLRGSSLTGTVSDGDPIDAWEDESGNGNDVSQSGASRPTYEAGVLNGEPIVRCANQHFDFDSDLALAREHTIFVVWELDTQGTGVCFGGTGGATYYAGYWGSNKIYYCANTAVAGDKTFVSEWAVVVIKVSDANDNISFYYNGTCLDDTDTHPNADLTLNELFAYNTNNLPLDGDVAEVIIYDTPLSDTDRETVEAYLGTKFNITIA